MEGEKDFIKPSFDGRQHFYRILGEYQKTLAEARFYDDYNTMEKSLRGFLSMVSPYIKDSEEIKKLLDKIKKFLKPKFQTTFKDHIENLIDEATFKLFDKSKYMMLPFSEEQNEEWDWEKFMKESDL